MSAEPADVLIIGAGASGGVVARRLAEAGFGVVCLEQGDWHDKAEYRGAELDWELTMRKQWSTSPNIRGLPEDYPIVCFYPMAKSRRDQDNWYRLSFEQRKRLMIQHGNSGRRFADRVTQLITTCTGIDDWEWGVTLFSKDLKAIRDIVYELRYDEASAVYGLFGAFYISVRFTPGQLAAVLKL